MARKAVGYIRVSTPGQAKEGESLNTQREAIEKYCEKEGLELAHVYEDAGISGAKSDRPALLQMLQDAESGHFSEAIVHSLSRFGRSAKDLLNNAEALKNSGVNFISIKERVDQSNAYGQFMFTVLSAIAELEREMIDERMRENRDALWSQKRIFMGQPPFGYKWDSEQERLVVDEEESAIYHKIVNMYLERNMTLQEIAETLHQEGKKKHARRSGSKKTAKWTSASISYILKNTAYYGRYYAKNGEIEYDIPALISKRRWDEIQERTQRRKKMSKRTGEKLKPYFLRNILYCGECGGRIRPREGAKRKDGSPYRYYVCYWSRAKESECDHYGRIKCDLPNVPADKLERQVETTFVQALTLNRKKHIDELSDPGKTAERISELENQRASLQQELDKKKKAREQIKALLGDPEMDQEELKQMFITNKDEQIDLEGRIQDIDNRKLELSEQRERAQEAAKLLSGARDLHKQVRQALRELDYEEKRRLFEGLCPKGIEVYSTYIEETGGIDWGFSPRIRLNSDIIRDVIGDKLNLDGRDLIKLIDTLGSLNTEESQPVNQ